MDERQASCVDDSQRGIAQRGRRAVEVGKLADADRNAERRLLPVSIGLTIVGSGIDALLLLRIPTRALQLTIGVAMVAVAVFSLLRHGTGTTERIRRLFRRERPIPLRIRPWNLA